MEKGSSWLNIMIDQVAENVDLLNSAKKITQKLVHKGGIQPIIDGPLIIKYGIINHH